MKTYSVWNCYASLKLINSVLKQVMTRSNGLGACILVKPKHDIYASRRKFARHAERKTEI